MSNFSDSLVTASKAESKAESSLTSEPASTVGIVAGAAPQGTDSKITQGTGLPKPLEQTGQIPAQPGGQQPAGKADATGFDYEWWKKDPRFGKIWHTEKDVIKSGYESDRILENKYKPAYKQYEGIVNKLKEFGYSSENIDDFFNEHKTLKDPNNPVNALGNLLLQWKGDPYVPDIEQFFKDLELKKMQRDYPGMTMQQINEFRTLQQKLDDIEKRESAKLEAEQKAKNEELKIQAQKEIDTQFAAIVKEASELGIPLTDEMKQKLFQYGIDTAMEPSLLGLAFRNMYKEQYDKAYENKVKAKILEANDKSRKTTVPINRPASRPPENKSFVDKFVEAVSREKSKT